jgi:hypothetical protein
MDGIYQRTFDLLERSGLNWSVRHQPRPFSGYRVVRKDNRKHLGQTRESLGPVQNAALCEALVTAGDRLGLVFDRGGAHYNGRFVYFQAPVAHTFIGRTRLQTLATVTLQHVGEQRMSFGATDCWVEGHKVFHADHSTARAVDILDSDVLADMIYSAMLDHRAVTKLYRGMAGTDLSQHMEWPIMTPIVQAMGIADPLNANPAERERMEYLKYTIDKELEQTSRTLWGVFNGILRYAYRQNRVNKTQSLMIGGGHDLTTTAYGSIRQWLDRKSLLTKYDMNPN